MTAQPRITHISQLNPNKKYSYADYCSWLFENRVELFNGIVHNKERSHTTLHQQVAGAFLIAIATKFRNTSNEVFHAPFDVRLPPVESTADKDVFNVVQTDLSVFTEHSKLDQRGGIGT